MNKQIKIVAIAVLLLAIAAIFFIRNTGNGDAFDKVKLDSSNTVLNSTPQKYLDTIILVGLNQCGLKDIIVSIYPLTKDIKGKVSSDYDIKANIVYTDSIYHIWIDESLDRHSAITVLSHELIHILQYYDGRLVVKENVPYWEGVKMPLQDFEYEVRPWEEEAVKLSVDLEKKLLNFLY